VINVIAKLPLRAMNSLSNITDQSEFSADVNMKSREDCNMLYESNEPHVASPGYKDENHQE